nr:uncharacterized protein LOC109160468 isoform X2 [Ipomoea batatas]
MSTSGEVFTVDVVKEMMNKCRQDIVTEMEAKMQPKIDSFNQQLQFLLKNISATHLFPHGVSDEIAQSVYTPCDLPLCDPPPTRSSCYSVDTYPVTTTKGMAHPSTDETVVHHQLFSPNCVKVWVDEVVDGGQQFILPMSTHQYATVGDIVGNFAQ